MNTVKHLLIAGCGLALAACASVSPYQPLKDGVGYSEQKLESNRFRISFAGNYKTPKDTVENYVLYRAAEVTLSNGFDYFTVASQDTQATPQGGGPTFGFGFGGIGVGSSSSVGLGVGTGGDPNMEYAGTADIVAYRGKKPADGLKTYDAREVKANLDPKIVRPTP